MRVGALLGLGGLVLLAGCVPPPPPGAAPGAPSPAAPPGFDSFFLDVAGQRMACAVWAPPGADRSRAWPAIVALHGSGECGTDGAGNLRQGLGPAVAAHPERWPFIVVLPQKPRDDQEWEEREDLLFAALDAARQRWRIDSDCIALTGFSQGGHGTWMIGARHPEQWSCLVPICGYGRGRIFSRAWRLPVWAFHGAKDDVVNPHESEEIVGVLREKQRADGIADGDPRAARLTLYPDANHGSWIPAYADSALPEWILAQRRAARSGR
jgi:predicted peptidase